MTSDERTGKLVPLTPKERAIVQKAISLAVESGNEMELHQCFRNAQAVLVADSTHAEGSGQLRYHEGYVPSPQGAAPHAWLTINGKIADVTLELGPNWERLSRKIAYYAADVIPVETVKSHFEKAKKSKNYGSVRGLRLTP